MVAQARNELNHGFSGAGHHAFVLAAMTAMRSVFAALALKTDFLVRLEVCLANTGPLVLASWTLCTLP